MIVSGEFTFPLYHRHLLFLGLRLNKETCNVVLVELLDPATLFTHNPESSISIAIARFNCDLMVQLLKGKFINSKLVVGILKANSGLYFQI